MRVLSAFCLMVLLGGAGLLAAESAEKPQSVPAGVPAPRPPPPPVAGRVVRPEADCVAPRPIDPAKIPEEQKQRVREVLAAYFQQIEPVEPSAEEAARIAKLVAELGSDEWARREAAGKALAEAGRTALGALRKALASPDPEIVERAAAVLKAIEAAAVKPVADEFPKLSDAFFAVVWHQLVPEARNAGSKARAAAREAEQAGKKEEAEKLRAEEKLLAIRVSALNELYLRLAPGSRFGLIR
jgi:hypothetical protein